MKFICTLVSSVLLTFVACLSWADDASSGSVAAALIAQLQPISALKGEFHQVQTDARGEELSHSRGHFVMQRPGLLRWETTAPFPQLLMTDGQQVWLYDPDLEQVTISPVSDQINQTPAVIFSGDLQQIDNQFAVSRIATPDNDSTTYSLRPRQKDAVYQQLEVRFENNVLASMRILDGFGQTTQFTLSHVVVTPEMSVNSFRFVPPPGTDVLRNE